MEGDQPELKLRPEEAHLAHKYEYRWANTSGKMGMFTLKEAESEGWSIVREHPRWPDSFLMRRPRG